MKNQWNEEAARQFGEIITGARLAARISQQHLGEKTHISRATIARLEAGRAGSRGKPVRPGVHTIEALADGLATNLYGVFDAHRARELRATLLTTAGYESLAETRSVRVEATLTLTHSNPASSDEAERHELVDVVTRLHWVVTHHALTSVDCRLISSVVSALVDRYSQEQAAAPVPSAAQAVPGSDRAPDPDPEESPEEPIQTPSRARVRPRLLRCQQGSLGRRYHDRWPSDQASGPNRGPG